MEDLTSRMSELTLTNRSGPPVETWSSVAHKVLGTPELLHLIATTSLSSENRPGLLYLNRDTRAQGTALRDQHVAPILLILAKKRCSLEDDERDAATLVTTCAVDFFEQEYQKTLVAYSNVRYAYADPNVHNKYDVDENRLTVIQDLTIFNNDQGRRELHTYLQNREHLFRLRVFAFMLRTQRNADATFTVSYASPSCNLTYFGIPWQEPGARDDVDTPGQRRFVGLANILCKYIELKAVESFTFVIEYNVYDILDYKDVRITLLTPFQTQMINFLKSRKNTLKFSVTLNFYIGRDGLMTDVTVEDAESRQFDHLELTAVERAADDTMMIITHKMSNTLSF